MHVHFVWTSQPSRRSWALVLWIALEFLSPAQEQFFTGLIAAITSLIEVTRFKIPSFNAWILDIVGPALLTNKKQEGDFCNLVLGGNVPHRPHWS